MEEHTRVIPLDDMTKDQLCVIQPSLHTHYLMACVTRVYGMTCHIALIDLVIVC
jgi:hypothetical protein